jgi:hypothetical protein
MTAVANTIFTAAQFNTHVRDNLNETAPAKATTAGSLFVATGTNAIAERIPAGQFTAAAETTASTSFVDLATVGPAVTATTGTKAFVFLRAGMENSGANSACHTSFEVSGATSTAASLNRAITTAGLAAASRGRIGAPIFVDNLVAGVNTFTAKYSVSANTGTFVSRELSVIPL